MKKIFVFLAVAGLLSSCNMKQKPETGGEGTTIQAPVQTDNAHNAKNSLDYQGIYAGVIPAADCPGIKISITLADSTYTRTSEYLKDGEKPKEEKGKYVWNEAGNTITLEGVEAPVQYFVGENTLTMLDMEGNKITGENADKYILKK